MLSHHTGSQAVGPGYALSTCHFPGTNLEDLPEAAAASGKLPSRAATANRTMVGREAARQSKDRMRASRIDRRPGNNVLKITPASKVRSRHRTGETSDDARDACRLPR